MQENFEICTHKKQAPKPLLLALHESQAGTGRHKCPNCAYNEGKSTTNITNVIDTESCQHGRVAPISVLLALPDSQGGSGRHKCCICAYAFGLSENILTIFNEPNDEMSIVEPKNVTGFSDKSDSLRNRAVLRQVNNDRNAIIGLKGEIFVLKYEISQLQKDDRPHLAQQVEHVAVTRGDGLGYDILSFDKDGNEKHIEVKTTQGTMNTPFFITRNEYQYSKSSPSNYFLYRVFNLNHKPQFFVLRGNLEDLVKLEPTAYLAYLKSI
mgnify:CR=1 FL=1